MKQDTLSIGILGLGHVGSSIVNILEDKTQFLLKRTGKHLKVSHILVRDLKKKRTINTDKIAITDNANDILDNPNIDIIIEVMGGEYPAHDYIIQALQNKKYVVTANKEVMSKHKETFFKLAKENQVDIYFEAAVGGGIPLIRALKVGFSANKINGFYGILNGTTNYILTKIEEEKKPFDEILKRAQDLGFAEADPTMDISGLDTAYKLDILAAVAFKTDIQLSNISYEGIEKITLTDIEYAQSFGYKIKLLAIGRVHQDTSMTFKVHPTLIPKDHPLAGIHNEINAIFLIGDSVGDAMLSGRGAGGDPTASAVLSDVIDIAFDNQTLTRRNLEEQLSPIPLKPMSETESQFYLRLNTPDTPGILEKITAILSNNQVSISKINQKDHPEEKTAEMVLMTHLCTEKQMSLVREQLNTSDAVQSIDSFIHVGLDEIVNK